MAKNFKNIGGFPSPFADSKVKESKEYGIAYLKQMYTQWEGDGRNSLNYRQRRFLRSRQYAQGIQNVGKYKDLLDVGGDSSYLNIDWTPVSIIPKFVDVVASYKA